MSNQTSPPAGYGTVTPWVISRDTARLIDFVQAAFGTEELARIPRADGGIGHAEVRIGDSLGYVETSLDAAMRDPAT